LTPIDNSFGHGKSNVIYYELYWVDRIWCNEIPLAKGPTTRVMARRIQEECASTKHVRPTMNLTWAKEDVKT